MSSPLDLVEFAKLIRDQYLVDMDTAVVEAKSIESKYQTYNEFIALLHEVYPVISHEDAQKEAWYYFMIQGGNDKAERQLRMWSILSEGSRDIVIHVDSIEPIDEKEEDKPSKSQMYNLSNYLRDDPTLLRKFRGNYIYEWGWLMWLQDHLPGDKFCIYKGKGDKKLPALHLEMKTKDSWVPDEDKKPKRKYLYIDRTFFQQLDECKENRPNLRFIIGILSLPDHSNALVFDFETRRIIRFEPHGGTRTADYRPAIIDNAIRKDLIRGEGKFEYYHGSGLGEEFGEYEKNYFQGWTYVSPIEFCPEDGPQAIEDKSKMSFEGEEGYCSAWSMIFMQQRVMQPEKSDEEIVKFFTRQTPDQLRTLIRNYATYFMGIVEENPLLFQRVDQKPESFEVGDYFYYIVNDLYPYFRGRIVHLENENKAIVILDKTWSKGEWAKEKLNMDGIYYKLYTKYMTKVTQKNLKQKIERGISKSLSP